VEEKRKMTVQRWEPINEMVTLRNAMDKLFEDSIVRPTGWWVAEDGWGALALDVFQTANEVVVKASLPGFKPEEVDISITGDTLAIKAEHKEESESRKGEYFLRERRYGSFSRVVDIPVGIKSDKAEAAFENGVLTLTLPKAEEAKPKQIKVKAKGLIEGGSGKKS
jgi:HSP20 family protein